MNQDRCSPRTGWKRLWMAACGTWMLAAASPPLFVAEALAQDKSSDYTEPYQKKALEIYRASIAYRSAEGHGQVPALARYLADQFRAGGFAEQDVHLLPFTVNDAEETAVLVVRYRGDGSSGKKPILLVAHMDVVDALPEDWERNPFQLTEEDGFFFGRGSLDDKFGTSVLTATFLRLKAEGFKTALVRNGAGRRFIMVVDCDRMADFVDYCRAEHQQVEEWLDDRPAG